MKQTSQIMNCMTENILSASNAESKSEIKGDIIQSKLRDHEKVSLKLIKTLYNQN